MLLGCASRCAGHVSGGSAYTSEQAHSGCCAESARVTRGTGWLLWQQHDAEIVL